MNEDLIRKSFPHTPTLQQMELFNLLHQFLTSADEDTCFILKGYAGTGKTTVLAALVKLLKNYNYASFLLAPTGRAAKVMSSYSGKKAFTIHKKIYRKKSAVTPDLNFATADNLHEDTLFIVDEASMISDESNGNGSSLLHDLVEFVYNSRNCKLLLIGDTAQLPPVGSENSAALEPKLLKDLFRLRVFSFELTEVMRQEKNSGILENVTAVRNLIRKEEAEYPQIKTQGFKDIYRMNGERLEEGLNYAYNKYGLENTLVICRSNKNANIYNQQVRARILYREEELTGGDFVMVVRNNYFWLKDNEETSTDFIANGDIGQIKRVRNIREMYGFQFADVQLEFTDYADALTLDCMVMLNTLYTETPSLSYSENQRFYEEVMKDYEHIASRQKKMEELKKNPYFNALQIKFAYAVTCHKAQGGQWEAVFVDQGYLTEEMLNTDFLRWFYTACTRATKELFLINFNQRFYQEALAE
ncbi:MAG: ATP-dependent RecD-like DNA helicase [Mucilaginibacter sp.]|uniref:ATP-dependent DNA helicase n=1 Tax=Mucilaginibacter sp. TaxID=1882438 RepID=UPI0034E4AD51